MAGIVMDTATFAHPNATPRTLAVSAALVEAGAPLSDISRRLYRSKPEAQLRLFGRGPRPARDRGRRADRPLVAVRRGPRRRPARSRPHSRGDHRPPRPGRGGRGRDRVQGGGRGDPAQRPDEARRRRRDRPDRGVRRRRPCPGGRGDDRRCRSPRPAAPSSPRPSGSSPRSAAERRAGPMDGILVAHKPRRPDVARRRRRSSGGSPRRSASATAGRSTRSRAACCRCSSAGRRGSSSTTSAIARATGRRSASARRRRPTISRATLTPADGPAPTRDGGRGGAGRRSAARSSSGRPPTARSRSPGGGRTRWPGPARPSSSQTRRVTIHALDARVVGRARSRTSPSRSLDVRCSAGTYVRALARDLGAAVGSARVPRRARPDRERPVHARPGDRARRRPRRRGRRAGAARRRSCCRSTRA